MVVNRHPNRNLKSIGFGFVCVKFSQDLNNRQSRHFYFELGLCFCFNRGFLNRTSAGKTKIMKIVMFPISFLMRRCSVVLGHSSACSLFGRCMSCISSQTSSDMAWSPEGTETPIRILKLSTEAIKRYVVEIFTNLN